MGVLKGHASRTTFKVTLRKTSRIACKGIAIPGPGTDLEFSSRRDPKPLKIKMAELPARGSSFARDLHLEELYENSKNQTNAILHIWHHVWTMDMTGVGSLSRSMPLEPPLKSL